MSSGYMRRRDPRDTVVIRCDLSSAKCWHTSLGRATARHADSERRGAARAPRLARADRRQARLAHQRVEAGDVGLDERIQPAELCARQLGEVFVYEERLARRRRVGALDAPLTGEAGSGGARAERAWRAGPPGPGAQPRSGVRPELNYIPTLEVEPCFVGRGEASLVLVLRPDADKLVPCFRCRLLRFPALDEYPSRHVR
jgi:hypothetical protein